MVDKYNGFFYLDFYIASIQFSFFSSSFHSPNKQFNCLVSRISPAVEESAS